MKVTFLLCSGYWCWYEVSKFCRDAELFYQLEQATVSAVLHMVTHKQKHLFYNVKHAEAKIFGNSMGSIRW